MLSRVLLEDVSSGLSRMTRKCHVRFLGWPEGIPAPGHPTRICRIDEPFFYWTLDKCLGLSYSKT